MKIVQKTAEKKGYLEPRIEKQHNTRDESETRDHTVGLREKFWGTEKSYWREKSAEGLSTTPQSGGK